MLIFGLHSTSDDRLGWSMDSNPICHPSPAKKIKCSFFDYVQLLVIGQANRWTWTPSATPLQPKKWNPHFWITFNFWWLAGLVNGLKPHLPPLSSQKKKCSLLDYIQLLMIGWAIWAKNVDRNAKKWKRPPKSSKNKMFVFGLCSTSDDRPSNLSQKHWTEMQKNEKGPLRH